MRKFYHTVISAEFFFAVFLFVGYFKEVVNFPIDLAAVFLAFTILAVLKRLYFLPHISKVYFLPVGLILLFMMYLIFGYFYSPNIIAAQEKVLKIIVLTIPAAILPFFILNKKENVRRLADSIVVISAFSALAILPVAINSISGVGFVGYGDGNYQGLARLTGAGLVFLAFYHFNETKRSSDRIGYSILILIFSFVLLSTGSRMPIIALGILVIYYLATSIKVFKHSLYMKKEVKPIIGLLILLVPFLTVAINKGYFSTVFNRFEILFSDGGGTSAAERVHRFDSSLSMWGDRPIAGNGTGSFGYLYNGTNQNDYPHNIVLELLVENGLIGLILFIFLITQVLYFLIKVKSQKLYSPLLTACVFFLVYFFINAMVSGDINSNRMFFASISILLTSCILMLDRNKEKISKTY
ncbi:O-antigen ligase family protein [Planococcus citreus]|uniref:O-antigen ligase n=1 Tax=Planococcus citreus TaxID=1373 RepID=A0A497YMD7_9BACL|nr:O-antigen ligase family protein [Planococcus citreus]RLJ90661.1 O-antigen ligase [Planococcus citreus]